MSPKSISIGFAAILALGFVAAGQCACSETLKPVSVRVRTSDIDLSTDAGARRLLTRIRYAALSACRQQDNDVVFASTDQAACVRSAIDRAVASANSAELAAVNGGGPAPTVLARRH
jgi:UrcA family protein